MFLFSFTFTNTTYFIDFVILKIYLKNDYYIRVFCNYIIIKINKKIFIFTVTFSILVFKL